MSPEEIDDRSPQVLFEQTLAELTGAIPSPAQWVVADEGLVEALARGRAVPYGRRSAMAFRSLHALRILGLTLPTAMMFGLVNLVQLVWQSVWIRPVDESTSSASTDDMFVFVGFGARAEEQLYREFSEHAPGRVGRVDQTRVASLIALRRPRRAQVWKATVSSIREATVAWRHFPRAFKSRRVDLAVSISRRLGSYIFSRAWWATVADGFTIRDARFVAADVMSFAAIREGVPSSFQQHGLLARGLIFPLFDHVHPLTKFEAGYLQRCLPAAVVHAPRKVMREARHVGERRLLIASANLPAAEMLRVSDLARGLASRGASIHVRLFPGESAERFWRSADIGAPFTIEDSDLTLDGALDRLRPMFIASWGSTVLVEALYSGIIPITVADSNDPYVARTAFPLFRCCLRWPQDAAAVADVLAHPEHADRVLERLRAHEVTG